MGVGVGVGVFTPGAGILDCRGVATGFDPELEARAAPGPVLLAKFELPALRAEFLLPALRDELEFPALREGAEVDRAGVLLFVDAGEVLR